MRILVVEDERRLADALTEILTEVKYMVDAVYNGDDGLAYAESGIYDVIVLDVMLPGKNGFEIVSALRKKKIATPVLMLTARGDVTDKIRGLDAGADDYMTKPFSPGELLARVRVLSRRKGEVVLDEMTFGDLSFRISSMELVCGASGRSIGLSFREGEMIRLLMGNAGSIVQKEDMITKIWGYDSDAGDNNVEAYISFLRKKLSHLGSSCEIVTVKRVGYKLEARDAEKTEA